MRTPVSEVFPIFRSAQYAAVLETVMSSVEELTQVEIAARARLTEATVSKVLRPLARAGIVATRTVGRRRLIRANTDAPFYTPLRDLVEITLGPPKVLAETLANVPGITEAFIFGSWAARMHQHAGPAPRDIDVLIIGDPDRGTLAQATEEAATRLRRDVNPLITTPDVWRDGGNALLDAIRTGPLIPIDHTPTEVNDDDATARAGDDRAATGRWESALLHPEP